MLMSAAMSISASSSLLIPSPEPPLPCWPGTPPASSGSLASPPGSPSPSTPAGVQREVDVEDGVERAAVPEALHQRRRQHLAERLPLGRAGSARPRASRRGSRSSRPGGPRRGARGRSPGARRASRRVADARGDLELVAGHARAPACRSARHHRVTPGAPCRTSACPPAPCAPWRCRSGTSGARAASRRSPAESIAS